LSGHGAGRRRAEETTVPSRLTDRERLIEFRDEGEFRRGFGRRTPLLWELLARDALRSDAAPVLSAVEQGNRMPARPIAPGSRDVETLRGGVRTAPVSEETAGGAHVDRAAVFGVSILILVLIAIVLTVIQL
jgi:hypothetical protein